MKILLLLAGLAVITGLHAKTAFAQENGATPEPREYPGFAALPQHRHAPAERKRTELAPGVYAFVGYSSSNFGVIAGKSGYILIDTGDDIAGATEALKEIKNLAPGPLQAVILTHGHPDHRGGAEVFLEGRSDVPIWGHADFGAEQKAGRGLERISAARAGRQFGVGIPDDQYPVNFMLPRFPGGKSGPHISPNTFVTEDRQEATIDGVRLELYRIPGESTDHVVIWLPEQQVLFSGDHVYGCYPNIYPVRGGAYRDVERWARAVRRLMEFKPKAMMFGHNHVPAPADIMPMLEKYAQAIEHVYAETIKGMDEGKTPDELAASVRLPDGLRGEPYLGEFYGAIPWAVRSIYAAKLATATRPTSFPWHRARRPSAWRRWPGERPASPTRRKRPWTAKTTVGPLSLPTACSNLAKPGTADA